MGLLAAFQATLLRAAPAAMAVRYRFGYDPFTNSVTGAEWVLVPFGGNRYSYGNAVANAGPGLLGLYQQGAFMNREAFRLAVGPGTFRPRVHVNEPYSNHPESFSVNDLQNPQLPYFDPGPSYGYHTAIVVDLPLVTVGQEGGVDFVVWSQTSNGAVLSGVEFLPV